MTMTLSMSAPGSSSSSSSAAAQIMVGEPAGSAAAADTPTRSNNHSASAPSPPPAPPWQFRWKRPRWDRVESGMDANDAELDDYDDFMDIDNTESIDESWTPISNSSVVLTRREAQTVIRELHRQKRLILHHSKRGGSRRSRSRSNDVFESPQMALGRKAVSSIPPPNPPLASPFASWWKSITSSSNNNDRSAQDDGDDDENKITTMSSNKKLEKPPIISITSPIYKPNNIGDDHDHDDNADNLSPPSSPTSFSTFSLQPTPKKNNNNTSNTKVTHIDNYNEKKEDWGGNDGDEGEGSSPQIVSDASMASSLLWGEDMTLTTVSEDEAAVYRLHQQGCGGAGTSAPFCESEWGGDSLDITYGKGSTGRKRYGASSTPAAAATSRKLSLQSTGARSHRQRQQPSSVLLNQEWGGYDHVVLSVTIFSTTISTSYCSQMNSSTMDERQRSGEVVVMEVLSTTNPPLLASTHGGRSIRPLSIPPPPPPPSPLPPRGRGKYTSSTASDTDESDSQGQRDNDDDDDNTTGMHTRVLSRRVLWWPSSILSGSGNAKNRRRLANYDRDGSSSQSGKFPSFVSLGRTSLRKHVDELQAPSAAHVKRGQQKDNTDDKENGHDNHGCSKNVHSKQGTPKSDDDEDEDERAADALEAVRSMNFLLGVGGLGTSSTETQKQNMPISSATNRGRGIMNDMNEEHSKSLAAEEKKRKVTQPLSMCIVTNNGQVHFFYVLRVLLSGISKKSMMNSNDGESMNNMDLSNSFAALLFGSKLFSKMNSNVLPLSHPHSSVQLSLIDSSTIEDDNTRGVNSNNPLSLRADYDTDFDMVNIEKDQNFNWSSLGLFDASIDPTSLHMCTLRRSNTLTGTCITSDTNNSYLALCGRGLRRIVHRFRHQQQQRQQSSHGLGGFVTFVSLRHYTEARTIYLPFAPESVQPVYWSGMHFVALLGEKSSRKAPRGRRPFAMLIRVDCCQGGCNVDNDLTRDSILHPARFQCLPIILPSVKESLGSLSDLFTLRELDDIDSKAVAISSIHSSPPEIFMTFQTDSFLFVVNHTLLQSKGSNAAAKANSMSLSTAVHPGNRALLSGGFKDVFTPSVATLNNMSRVWCIGGQGWSLVGTHGSNGKTYFICWDGASDDSQGPFIFPFQPLTLSEHTLSFCLNSAVVPLMSYVKYAEKVVECSRHTVDNPSTTPARQNQNAVESDEFSSRFAPENSISSTLKESIQLAANIEGGLDDIFVHALESISANCHQMLEANAKSMVGSRRNRSKCLRMSHYEKSNRLLRICSSWTMLDDSKENRGIASGQVIVATVRLGSRIQSLTLRTNIIANPISTPFQTVLSWLCQRHDYYTAASVALRLLDDAEAVYELCGIKSFEGSSYYHMEVLDGIKPLSTDSSREDTSETLVSLADMAVACLIKGGACMSSTLEGFLSRNKLYSAPRASIMLVGTLAAAVSKEPLSDVEQNSADNIVDMVSTASNPSEDVIWPLRCLIKLAVVRNCLPSAILMLNATLSNELRWRAPKSQGLASAPRPSLGLFMSLSGIILESTEKATRYFLSMMDEDSGLPYWYSIDDDTRLALILMSIRGKRAMLQEPEVRTWALDRLHDEIKQPTSDSAYFLNGSLLRKGILTEFVVGALCNAECYLSQGMDAIVLPKFKAVSRDEDVACYRLDMLRVRDLLVPNIGGLDYDLVIASLLILARRGCDFWREGSQISTRILLNTVCDLAGRKSDVEPNFIFDGATAMRQCALAENLQAAAFLVGGKKGLIIECMDLLVSNFDVTVQDAELLLFVNSLMELKRAVPLLYGEDSKQETDATIFVPSESHRHLLWLLQEHVLSIHTYGEFDAESQSSRSRGKVTPVFAGRICFRAWYCLTSPSALQSSALWLENWLRRRVELANGESPKRLACAALARVLLWADESDDIDFTDNIEEEEEEVKEEQSLPLLATVIGLKRQFLAELAQACCGLLQSIPPHIVEELMSSCTAGGPNLISFESSLVVNTAQHKPASTND